tara:strand:+ start:1113 stop:2843 length:1731 start_codon:yes stop_codon:yes gene_type:complete
MTQNYIVLGLNYGGHDTSACLMIDGKLIVACEEERYSKQKHTRDFPKNAINDCLKKANLSMSDVDEITLSYDPALLKFENFNKITSVTRKKFNQDDLKQLRNLRDQDFDLENYVKNELNFNGKISTHLHHLCHLASSYYPSGFDESLIISHDGIGEVDCSLMAKGVNGEIEIFHHGNQWPNSLGLLYAGVTAYLGWKYNSDEGIVMGLAPYGDYNKLTKSGKTYREIFSEIIFPVGDFDYEIDKSWIAFHEVRSKWVSSKFIETFGDRRNPDDPPKEHHKDVAAALQNRLEEIILHQLKKCKEKFNIKKLCFAGGIALNCSLNGKILLSGLFDEIFIPPASGDNGTAIGACYISTKKVLNELLPEKSHNFYLGSEFTNEDIENALEKNNVKYEKYESIEKIIAKKLNEKKIIGWFQGGAEFGPRALGNRSILTSPFPKEMKDILNSRVKFRESFRPFAPAILSEFTNDYFEITQPSPHMLIAVNVKSEKIDEIPAVVHVDGSARVQTVTKSDNPKFRKLLESFYDETNCPVILNTSFNVKGQPIVNSPDDAIKCFLSTNIDVLAIGDFVANKDDQS